MNNIFCLFAVKMIPFMTFWSGDISEFLALNELEPENPAIRKLQDDCYQELFDHVQAITTKLGKPSGSILSSIILRAMSINMPYTEDEILQFMNVKKSNYEKCGGSALFKIIEKYREKKEGT